MCQPCDYIFAIKSSFVLLSAILLWVTDQFHMCLGDVIINDHYKNKNHIFESFWINNQLHKIITSTHQRVTIILHIRILAVVRLIMQHWKLDWNIYHTFIWWLLLLLKAKQLYKYKNVSSLFINVNLLVNQETAFCAIIWSSYVWYIRFLVHYPIISSI